MLRCSRIKRMAPSIAAELVEDVQRVSCSIPWTASLVSGSLLTVGVGLFILTFGYNVAMPVMDAYQHREVDEEDDISLAEVVASSD